MMDLGGNKMNDDRFERSIDELETHACKWWPDEVREEVKKVSVLYPLLDSQEKFISLLKLADKNNPMRLFNLISSAEFPWNLFLKHLIVLVDFASEPLQRINNETVLSIGPGCSDDGLRTASYRLGSRRRTY